MISFKWRYRGRLVCSFFYTHHSSASSVNVSFAFHYALYALKYCVFHYVPPCKLHAFHFLTYVFHFSATRTPPPNSTPIISSLPPPPT